MRLRGFLNIIIEFQFSFYASKPQQSALVFYGLNGYSPRGNTWSISGARAVGSHGVPKVHLLLLLLSSSLLLFEDVLLFAPAVGLDYITILTTKCSLKAILSNLQCF